MKVAKFRILLKSSISTWANVYSGKFVWSLDFKLFKLLENFLEKIYLLQSISFLLEVAEMFLKEHCWVCDLFEGNTLEFFNFRKCWRFLVPNFWTNGCSKTDNVALVDHNSNNLKILKGQQLFYPQQKHFKSWPAHL